MATDGDVIRDAISGTLNGRGRVVFAIPQPERTENLDEVFAKFKEVDFEVSYRADGITTCNCNHCSFVREHPEFNHDSDIIIYLSWPEQGGNILV